MAAMRNSTARAITVLLVCLATYSPAADWTALHGSDPAGTGVAEGETIQLPLRQLWAFETNGRVRSSASIAADTVYFGSCDGNVYALDASSGSRKWTFKTGAEVYSSPTATGGAVFVGSRDGKVYALDAKSGARLWEHDVGRPVRASGVVVDGVLYVGSGEVPHEGGAFEQRLPNLWALDAKTGKPVWEFKCGGIWGRPAVADGILYVASMGANISAIDARTGNALWDVHTQAGPFWSSPVIYDKSLFIGSIDKNLKCLYVMNIANGHWRWQYSTGGPSEPTVCVADDAVYCWGYWTGVVAVDMAEMPVDVRDSSVPPAKDGWIKGTHPGALALSYDKAELHRVFSKRGKGDIKRVTRWQAMTGKVRAGLIMGGDYLWVASQGAESGRSQLFAIRSASGEIVWKHELGGECWSTPAISGGRAFVGCDDGRVYCFGR
jgi:outer membrane protein assembly factor BamB